MSAAEDEGTNAVARFSRHPLTLMVVGFLLTGVVGTVVSNRFSASERERERFLQVTEARRAAIQDFARTLYERRGRADLLANAVRRRAGPAELRERKRAYDETYLKWERDLQANLFMIRGALESDEYTSAEGDVETRLAPLLRQLDNCVTAAYDRQLQGGDGGAELQRCGYADALSRSRACAYAVTDQLFRMAVRTSPPGGEEAARLREAARAAIDAACGASQ